MQHTRVGWRQGAPKARAPYNSHREHYSENQAEHHMRRPHAEAEWAAWEPTGYLTEDPQNRNEAYCQPVQPDCGRIVALVALSTSVRLRRERPLIGIG